jgi:hypothetical protein
VERVDERQLQDGRGQDPQLQHSPVAQPCRTALSHSPAAQPCNREPLKVAPDWQEEVDGEGQFSISILFVCLSTIKLINYARMNCGAWRNTKAHRCLHYSRPNVEREEKANEILEIHVYN